MIYINALGAILLTVSISLNIYLFVKSRRPKKQVSYDATALLQDLLSGAALVKVTRIAPEDVFLRSNKR